MTTRNRSAACGAWKSPNPGMGNAHDHCTGKVALPAPNDICTCWCHGRDDGEDFDGTDDEFAMMTEAREQWRSEDTAMSFADWLVAP